MMRFAFCFGAAWAVSSRKSHASLAMNSTQKVSAGSPVYLGCFKDTGNRALSYKAFDGTPGHLHGECETHCKSQNFLYMGLQWKGQCFCGNDEYEKHGTADDCNVDHTNTDPNHNYGDWRMLVYALEYIEPVLVGCFQDEEAPHRDLSTKLKDTYNLADAASQAADAGFEYFGLQYHGQLWAGNWPVGEHGIKDLNTDCNVFADGTTGNMNFGSWKNIIYRVRPHSKKSATRDQHDEIIFELQKVAVEARETSCSQWRDYLTTYNNIMTRLFDLGAAGEKKGTFQLINGLDGADTNAATIKSIETLKTEWDTARQESALQAGKMKRYSTHAQQETDMAARLAKDQENVMEKYSKNIQQHKTLLVAYADAYVAVTKADIPDIFKQYLMESGADDNIAYESGTMGICLDGTAAGQDATCGLLFGQDKNACLAAAANGCEWHRSAPQGGYCLHASDTDQACPNTLYAKTSTTKAACMADTTCLWKTGAAGVPDQPSFIQTDSAKEPQLTFQERVNKSMNEIAIAMAKLSPEHRQKHYDAVPEAKMIFTQAGKMGGDLMGSEFNGWFNSAKTANGREELIANYFLGSAGELDKQIKTLQDELAQTRTALKTLEDRAKDDAIKATNDAQTALLASETAQQTANSAQAKYESAVALRDALQEEQTELVGELAHASTKFAVQMGEAFDVMKSLHTAGVTLYGDAWKTEWQQLGDMNSAFMSDAGSNTDGLRCGDEKEAQMSAEQLEGVVEEFGNYNGAANVRGVYFAQDKFWEKKLSDMFTLVSTPAFSQNLDGSAWKDNYVTFPGPIIGYVAVFDNGKWQEILEGSIIAGDALRDWAKREMRACAEWHGTHKVACETPATNKAPGCWWDEIPQLCMDADLDAARDLCAPLDETMCATYAECEWTGAKCQKKTLFLLQVEAHTQSPGSCDQGEQPIGDDAVSLYMQNCNEDADGCVYKAPKNLGDDHVCESKYQPDQDLIAFTVDKNMIPAFNTIVTPLRQRKQELLEALQKLRTNQGECKLRLRQHEETMHASILLWEQSFSRFATARNEWMQASASLVDAQDRVAAQKQMMADASMAHAKIQAQHKFRMAKWQKAERALSLAIGQLKKVALGPFQSTVRLLDSVRDRIVRQQAQADEDLTHEHTEYKKNFRTAQRVLDAFKTEEGNSDAAASTAFMRMEAEWNQVKFLDSAGEEQDPSLTNFETFDEYPVYAEDNVQAGRLMLDADGLPNLVMSSAQNIGGSSATDGTQTQDVWEQTKDVLKFDNCATVQISNTATADQLLVEPLTGTLRDSVTPYLGTGGDWTNGPFDHKPHTSNGPFLPDLPGSEALYNEVLGMTWAAAEASIQDNINEIDALLGMLARVAGGTAQTSNIAIR